MKIAIVIATLALTGCATSARMSKVDLDHYVIDCNRRDEQTAFIQSQMPSGSDRLIASMKATSPIGTVTSLMDGTYDDNKAVFNREQQAIARVILAELRSCPIPQPKPQGCTTVLEQMPSGNGQGTRCYRGNNPTPVTNRWEALVD